MVKDWGGKRYNNLNYFLRNKFGEKVFKISLDGGFSCPNRDGTISKGGCLFCSERGSGDFAGDRDFSIEKQFIDIKDMMNKKWKQGKYIAYFQAYTNTYAPVDVLKKKYEEALSQEGVVALAIATRPDCLEDDVVDYLAELNERTNLWVELGLQTIHDVTSKKINRGHDYDTFLEGLKKLQDRNIKVVVHIINGLPGEDYNMMMETAKAVADMNVHGIKIHLLHVIKDTALARSLEKKQFELMDRDDYINLVCDQLEILPPEMIIHRLTGDGKRDELVGPMWSLKKWEVLNDIDKTLKERDTYQGIYYNKK